MGFASIVAGFLIVGLHFGQMMNRAMSLLFVGLFSLVCFGVIIRTSRLFDSFIAIAFQIRERAVEGADLSWYPIATSPEIPLRTMASGITLVMIIGYVGSLIFFFNTRKLDPKQFK